MLGHILILLEVIDEKRGELLSLLIVGFLISPHSAGIEDLIGHIGAGLGNEHVEDGMTDILNVIESAGEGCCDHGAGILDLHTGTDAVGTAGPTGIDEERVGVMLIHALTEHLRVEGGMLDEERSAEQRGEGRLRLLYAALCAGKLRGIAGDEMVHGHILIELRDGGQYAEGVRGEEYDRLGMTGDAGNEAVGDIIDGIRDAGILRDGAVVIIEHAGLVIHNDVLDE